MYGNTWYLFLILVANIIWLSGHAIRSSYLRDFSFLLNSFRRIFTVFYVTTIQHDRFGRALDGDTFWPPNRNFNAQKYGQGELSRRLHRLFIILNTAINQKMQKNLRVIGILTN